MFQAVKIRENIYFVGAIDYDLRNFHGYLTQRGATYNAFLIIDEKITLIDTVKAKFSQEMIERIQSVVDPSKIDYIICNHVEPDHSGALPEIVKLAPNAKIITSLPSGVKGLTAHYGDFAYQGVKTNDELCIGKRTLKFVNTPMLHWPDNMITYCKEEKILFSNDAFGQHLATKEERYDDEYNLDIVMYEAKKYYANIVLPFVSQVQGALKVAHSLDIEMICPSHGLIWRSHVKQILELYANIVNDQMSKKAVIIYDTMWGNTEKMAYAIQKGFEQANIETKIINLHDVHYSDAIVDIMESKYVALGASTLNNGVMPSIAAILCYIKGLSPKNKHFVAFGSYGWSGQSPQIVYDELISAKFEPLMDLIKVQYVPSKEKLEEIKLLVAQAVIK